jgi:hypothetical protein
MTVPHAWCRSASAKVCAAHEPFGEGFYLAIPADESLSVNLR